MVNDIGTTRRGPGVNLDDLDIPVVLSEHIAAKNNGSIPAFVVKVDNDSVQAIERAVYTGVRGALRYQEIGELFTKIKLAKSPSTREVYQERLDRLMGKYRDEEEENENDTDEDLEE